MTGSYLGVTNDFLRSDVSCNLSRTLAQHLLAPTGLHVECRPDYRFGEDFFGINRYFPDPTRRHKKARDVSYESQDISSKESN